MNLLRSLLRSAPLALALLALQPLRVRAQTVQKSYLFNTGTPQEGVSLYGNAHVDTSGPYLVLTESLHDQIGTVILDPFPKDQWVTSLQFDFLAIISQGPDIPADGLSFNFGPNLVNSAIGEDGATRGLVVTLDTYENENDTAPAVEVVYDGKTISGVSFGGHRTLYQPYWPMAKDGSGNPLLFNTANAFVPVSIRMDSSNRVSMFWNGFQVLTNVPVPYTPAAGWRLALGARTGGKVESHFIKNVEITATTVARVVVSSDFGGGFVSPQVGTNYYNIGEDVSFAAPRYIYLDRYKQPIGTSLNALSATPYYRARYAGVSIDGGATTHIGDRSFAVTVTSGMSVQWQWDLEFLGNISTGTEDIDGLSPSDVTDPSHVDKLGDHFYGNEADAGEIFSSVVFAKVGGADTTLPIQFATTGYVLENAPNPTERVVQLSPGQDHLRANRTGISWGAFSDLTLDFWMRAEPTTTPSDIVALSIGKDGSGAYLSAGFSASGDLVLSNPAAGFEARLAGYFDNDWHHWALAYDSKTQSVLFYRDGVLVHSEQSAVHPLAGATDPVVVGGLLDADLTTLQKPFSGGINNLRIWSKALSNRQLRHAMRTPVYGVSVAGLELELPLDTLIPPLANGADTQLWVGGTNAITSVDQITNLMTLTGTFPSANLSLLTNAPATFFGLVFQSTFLAANAGGYTFYLKSDDNSRLIIDGQVVVDNTEGHATEKSGTIPLEGGYHDLRLLYFQGSSTKALEVSYSTEGATKQAIPNNLLFRSRSTNDPPISYLQLQSSEGRRIPFALFHYEAPFPPATSSSDQLKTLFPGFEFKEVTGTGVNVLHLTDAQNKELSYALTDWSRVSWRWQKQFQLAVQVSAPDVNTVQEVARLPFFGGDVQLDGMTTNIAHLDSASTMTALKTWVPERELVTVGTRYRTTSGCFQLGGISGQQNGFGIITPDQLVDGTAPDGTVSREYAFTNGIVAPGTLLFNFGPTVYKAEIPIGEGLDVSSTAAANAQLAPNLCGSGPALRIDLAGPTVVATPQAGGNGVLTGGDGLPYAWDFAARKFYPLKPGTYTLQWADAKSPGKSYVIQINAQFPTETVTIQDRENDDGSRQGTAPDYLTDVTYPGTDAAYPASPGGHYHYVVSPNADDPTPAQLDPQPGDRWKFQRLAFSEDPAAQADIQTGLFRTTTSGIRTVLLFSYSTNASQVATGDLAREGFAVRIVQSLAVSDSETNLSATVGTRITSELDTAGYGSGFLLYEVSNYTPQIYHRQEEVGAWGPIYPVNWSGLYQADNRRLRVAWYQNPYLKLPTSTLHPNVAWPYIVANYDDVQFPGDEGNIIYLASRLGSEGVNAAGIDQLVFDPARYANVAIYNQPDRSVPGYNPNEEHALIAPSIKAQLTGDPSYKLGQPAAFALQREINVYGATDSNPATTANQAEEFTSEPVVLVQYDDLTTGEKAMQAYRVELTRTGTEPFPKLDPDTHLPTDASGQPIPQPADPTYDFDYPGFAGDLVARPYPLNLVVGNVIMQEDQGGNLQVDGVNQRTLWFDKNQAAWMVAGNGSFFYQFWYPFREDFWFDASGDRVSDLQPGVPFAWLPTNGVFIASSPSTPAQPRRIVFDTYWRDDYAVLKRGESLTYPGGEHFAEHPTTQGLPGIVGWASAQLIYDSSTPDMIFTNLASLESSAARVIRPLDTFSVSLPQADLPIDLTPADTAKVMVSGTRWHFKELVGSLQKRFYYDSLVQKLVFRGRLNDLEGDNGRLTEQPASLYVLEPNVMTPDDFDTLTDLAASDSEWTNAVRALYLQSQNPEGVLIDGVNPASVDTPVYLAGVDSHVGQVQKQVCYYLANGIFLGCVDEGVPAYMPLNGLGTGAALVPNPTLLTVTNTAPYYLTLVENNHPEVEGAVALHIVRISDERFRGAIKVIEAQNAFDEKINLKHTADFGGNTARTYYQWWVRDVASLTSAHLPGQDTAWQLYAQGLGLNQIAFTGRPDVALSDKFFYVRYGEESEFQSQGSDPEASSVPDSNWRLVDLNDPKDSYAREPGKPAPYQWAGAANSPQLQADGTRAYVPQLVMGWVKRVLDRINPYEARFADFANHDSPAAYTSFLRSAGAPYVGDVALNADKDALENVGLIQLYETILHRAKSLTLDVPGASTQGTDQALLLAATRLAELYDLLAREAYADAQNPTLLVTPENGLAAAAPYVHAFYNQEASLLHEELALLRGTDYLKSYPVYNRLFWNYVKGPGEAAYNANYQVGDLNTDGFVNEADAAIAYPQGHGDAWGHFLSAEKMHYELLRNTAFDWGTRSEYYALLDNVLPADFLDEKTFARVAAAKARTGKEIVNETYALAYTSDPDGQWQGYTDTADPARAWGVSEWGKRAGQGALFDWIVGNALVPTLATNSAEASSLDLNSASGLDQIDRRANQDELAEIASAFVSIQQTLESANAGDTPLGLDPDALVFDLDPSSSAPFRERKTHFEQVLERAVRAARNALAAHEFASRADQQLARLNADSDSLKRDAVRQDLSFRNRLVEIFGMPYAGTIGPGRAYPAGYAGPDVLLHPYIDHVHPEDFLPGKSPHFTQINLPNLASQYADQKFKLWIAKVDLKTIPELFDELFLTTDIHDNDLGSDLTLKVPLLETSDYAFQAPPDWGRRGAYGRLQTLLGQMLAAQTDLEGSVDRYNDYIEGMVIRTAKLNIALETLKNSKTTFRDSRAIVTTLEAFARASESGLAYIEGKANKAFREAQAIAAFLPRVNGLDNDVTSAARGAALQAGVIVDEFTEDIITMLKIFKYTGQFAALGVEFLKESDEVNIEQHNELLETLSEYSEEYQEEPTYRLAMSGHLEHMHAIQHDYQTALAEGARLLEERGSLNKFIAISAQKGRYHDMTLRLVRNDALSKYQSAYENAQRYAWLAAKAYEYETALAPGNPGSASSFLDRIVKTRQLGNWDEGTPRIGNGGLAEILAQLSSNFDTLKGQLGINNPQRETDRLSLRYENFRILKGTNSTASSDDRWRQALQLARVDDLRQIPEFVQYCRPFADFSSGPQPGVVLEFSTEINAGANAFGKALSTGDHAFSTANFATKIQSVGLWLENYSSIGLSVTPRFYLVPVGLDRLRTSDTRTPTVRDWNVVEQRIPVPFAINEAQLSNPNYIPSLDSIDGSFADRRRFGDLRAYDATATLPPESMNPDSRLIGRSVWNTRWLLIIPGATLAADPEEGLQKLIGSATSPGISDILLEFETYSHQGL